MMLGKAANVWGSLSAHVRRAERLRTAAIAVYYLAVLVGLLVMYGRGQFTAPSYVYQGF